MNSVVEETTAQGLKELLNIAPIVTALVLFILILLFFIRALLKEAKEDKIQARKESELTRNALINNTAVNAELKELVRNALNR